MLYCARSSAPRGFRQGPGHPGRLLRARGLPVRGPSAPSVSTRTGSAEPPSISISRRSGGTVLRLGTRTVPVPRAEHLVAMKVHAMRNDPSRTLQEMADIQFLMRRPGVDDAEIRAYFERAGLEDRYHEIPDARSRPADDGRRHGRTAEDARGAPPPTRGVSRVPRTSRLAGARDTCDCGAGRRALPSVWRPPAPRSPRARAVTAVRAGGMTPPHPDPLPRCGRGETRCR